MSASVPTSPSWLKSAELVQGAAGQWPAMHAKKDSISRSVPVSPSQLKSAESQAAGLVQVRPTMLKSSKPASTTAPVRSLTTNLKRTVLEGATPAADRY